MTIDAGGPGPVGITKIHLVTRNGNAIDNLQAWEHSRFEWSQLEGTLDRFKDPQYAFPLRHAACPVYNCHGLTFASRRSAVASENKVIQLILSDDGYDEIDQKNVQPGDIIVYYDELGAVQHSGIVVEVLQRGVSRVWSKWGKGCEWIHHFNTGPYAGLNQRYYRICRWQTPKPKGLQLATR